MKFDDHSTDEISENNEKSGENLDRFAVTWFPEKVWIILV